MRQKSKLKGRKASWVHRCLRIEWGWDRRGWNPQLVRKVYHLYQDWDKLEDDCCQAESVVRKFYGHGKGKLTRQSVRDMVESYRNYLKAIEDGKSVKQEDCSGGIVSVG